MTEPNPKIRACAFAETFAAKSGLDVQVHCTGEEPDALTVTLEGPDAHFLVGRNAQTLDALQYLASLAVNRRGEPRLRLLFDADGYRARREKTLQKLAEELAAEVKSTGQEAVLDPLSPLERRIVHTALADDPGVRTYSEGEEPERYIIISPAT